MKQSPRSGSLGVSMSASLHLPGLSISAASRSRIGGSGSSHQMGVSLRMGGGKMQLSAFSHQSRGSGRSGKKLSGMSQQRKGAYKSPELSDIVSRGFDVFSGMLQEGKAPDLGGPKSGSGAAKPSQAGKSGSSGWHVSGMDLSDNPARAKRQEQFLNTHMPHLKQLSSLQAGMESAARKMMGLPEPKPKPGAQASSTGERHDAFASGQQQGGGKRSAISISGLDFSSDPARAARQKAFVEKHMPFGSKLMKLKSSVDSQNASASESGAAKHGSTGQAGPKRSAISIEGMDFSSDPARAARQKEFIQKNMPFGSALLKLKSSLDKNPPSASKSGAERSTGAKSRMPG